MEQMAVAVAFYTAPAALIEEQNRPEQTKTGPNI